MSGKRIPERHKTRYRLAQAQLELLPSAQDGSEDEFAGLRFQCEEVIEFCEELGAAEAALEILREQAISAGMEDTPIFWIPDAYLARTFRK